MLREEPKEGQEKGKISSRRATGIYLIALFTILLIAIMVFEISGISDTILGSILGGGVGSIGLTLKK